MALRMEVNGEEDRVFVSVGVECQIRFFINKLFFYLKKKIFISFLIFPLLKTSTHDNRIQKKNITIIHCNIIK